MPTNLLEQLAVEVLAIERRLVDLPVARVHDVARLAAQDEPAAVRDAVRHPDRLTPAPASCVTTRAEGHAAVQQAAAIQTNNRSSKERTSLRDSSWSCNGAQEETRDAGRPELGRLETAAWAVCALEGAELKALPDLEGVEPALVPQVKLLQPALDERHAEAARIDRRAGVQRRYNLRARRSARLNQP